MFERDLALVYKGGRGIEDDSQITSSVGIHMKHTGNWEKGAKHILRVEREEDRNEFGLSHIRRHLCWDWHCANVRESLLLRTSREQGFPPTSVKFGKQSISEWHMLLPSITMKCSESSAFCVWSVWYLHFFFFFALFYPLTESSLRPQYVLPLFISSFLRRDTGSHVAQVDLKFIV